MRKKKKKRKKIKEEITESNISDEMMKKKTRGQEFIEELKCEMKLRQSFQSKTPENMSNETESRVQTLYDKYLNEKAISKKKPEVVVFEEPRKKRKKDKVQSQSEELTFNNDNDSEDKPEFDLKRARFEVRKFGMKGFQGDQKDEAMTALLVKLGAKPPKNKYYNYKEFQEIRKKEMVAQKDKREIDRGLGYKTANRNKNKKREKNDVGFVDGQVGKYKSGVQFVRKNDLIGFEKNNKHKW